MLNLATKFKPRPKAVEIAQAAGFTSAELWLDEAFLLNHETIIRLADQSAMSFALHFPNKGQLGTETLRNAVDLYHRLNCSAMVIHAPMLSKYGNQLRQMDNSLRLATENHRLSLQSFWDWATEHPWLTLDVEHLWKFTLQDAPLTELLQTVEKFLDEFGEKLAHVHMPGYLPGGGEHRPMYCSREMVRGVLTLLHQARFEGFIVSEVNTKFQNVYELSMDVLLFQHWSHDACFEETRDPRVA